MRGVRERECVCVRGIERKRERREKKVRKGGWDGRTDRWMEGYTYIYYMLYNTLFDKK